MNAREQLQTTIESAFSGLKKAFDESFKKFYNDLNNRLANRPAEQWSQEIAKAERSTLADYNDEIYNKTKDAAQTSVQTCGLSKSDAILCWTLATQNVRLPEIEVIPFRKIDTPNKPSGMANDGAGTMPTPPSGKWLIIAGACVEIVGWFFIPNRGWAALVKGIGLVLLAAGILIETKSRKSLIKPSDDLIRRQHEDALKLLSGLCAEQCEKNLGIVTVWLNTVKEQFITECLKALDGNDALS